MIYGTKEITTPALLDQARLTVTRLHLLQGWNVLIHDKHGLDAEVARLCREWHIPHTVFGSTVRPRNAASLKGYERVLAGAGQSRDNAVIHYMLNRCSRVIVIGESADCLAVRTFARVLKKDVHHRADVPVLVHTPVMNTDDLLLHGHFWAG